MRYWRTPLDQNKIKKRRSHIHILPDRCKGCKFCINFCPKHVLRESEEFNIKGYHPVCVANEDECAGCGLCEMICPDFAISVTTTEDTPHAEEVHA